MGGWVGGSVPWDAAEAADGELVEELFGQFDVSDEEEFGVVLEEGEGVVDDAHEDVLLEEGVEVAVWRGWVGRWVV